MKDRVKGARVTREEYAEVLALRRGGMTFIKLSIILGCTLERARQIYYKSIRVERIHAEKIKRDNAEIKARSQIEKQNERQNAEYLLAVCESLTK